MSLIRPRFTSPTQGSTTIGKLALAIGVLFFFLSAPAKAQETAEDFIEPRVTRAQFAALIQPLNLERDLKNIAELAYSDYSSTISDLTRTMNDQSKQAGRQTVQDALGGKARVAPDELKRMRVAVLRVYEQGFPIIDGALSDLLDGISGVLTAQQAQDFDRGVRELRRDIMLHPRQSGSDYQEYAGDGVDMLLLVENALKDGGELQPLGEAALQDILGNYEVQLDAYLNDTAASYRRGKLMRKIATIEKDAATLRTEEQAALARWKQLYQLNQHTMDLIANAVAAAEGGETAKQRWLDRCEKATFTWLFPRKKPDRQIEWMRQQKLPADKMQQAETIYEQFIAKRKALSRKAIDLMVRGRLEFQTILYSMMDPAGMDDRVRRGIYEELVKNTGEQANLESSTSSSLETLLTDAQRQAMRDAMKGPDPANRRR